MRDLSACPLPLPAFVAYLEAHERATSTINTYVDSLCRFADYLAETHQPTEPAQFTVATMTGFASWLRDQTSPATRALYFASLSVLMQYLAINRMLSPDAGLVADMQAELRALQKAANGAARKATTRHDRLPADEIVMALLAAVDPRPSLSAEVAPSVAGRLHLIWARDRAMLHTLATSGMRIAELAALTRADLDRKTQAAVVTGKGQKRRLTPIGKPFALIEAYLLMRQDGGRPSALGRLPVFARHDSRAGGKVLPLTTRSVENIVMRYAEVAGVLDKFHLTPHTLRHFVATRFLQTTGDLALTQDLLGHASPETTRLYAETDHSGLLAAHRATFNR